MGHVLLILLDIDILLALVPAGIAGAKGKNFLLWWLYGAACLPFAPFVQAWGLKPAAAPDNTPELPGPDVPGQSHVHCVVCAEPVDKGAPFCPHCGHDQRGEETVKRVA